VEGVEERARNHAEPPTRTGALRAEARDQPPAIQFARRPGAAAFLPLPADSSLRSRQTFRYQEYSTDANARRPSRSPPKASQCCSSSRLETFSPSLTESVTR